MIMKNIANKEENRTDVSTELLTKNSIAGTTTNGFSKKLFDYAFKITSIYVICGFVVARLS